jgi:hypothetical protein
MTRRRSGTATWNKRTVTCRTGEAKSGIAAWQSWLFGRASASTGAAG